MASSRNWCFTLNNPSDSIMKPNTWPDMKYVIWQVESGANGTPHWQGYITFKTNKKLTFLKNRCSRNAHWEIRKGTHDQAVEYCSKTDTRLSGPFIFGDPPKQGKRTDLDDLKKDLDEGVSLRLVASNSFAPYIKYARGIQSYRRLMSSPRNFKSQVTVLYGETGVGKSKLMQTFCPLAYWKTTGDKWWDDYDFQETVVIDEFYGWLPYAYLLRLLDRYPMYVETKGGMVNFVGKHIFMAANNPPDQWYNWTEKMKQDPLMRRIDNLLYVEENEKITVIKGVNPFDWIGDDPVDLIAPDEDLTDLLNAPHVDDPGTPVIDPSEYDEETQSDVEIPTGPWRTSSRFTGFMDIGESDDESLTDLYDD